MAPLRLCALLAAFSSSLSAPSWIFSRNSSWVDLTSSYQRAGTPTPLSLGLNDLARDWYRVIGVPPIVLSAPPNTSWDGSALLILTLNASLSREQFTLTASATPLYACLTIAGGDVRGLLYGLYQFSGDWLGVDPFYALLDLPVAYAGVIDFPSPDYAYDSGVPAFYSRGAFFNDEEVSAYFASDPVGDSVYTGALADAFCELLLRLRVNSIIPSTFGFVSERHYRVAAARGLMLGNHHVMPMGLNVYAWPFGVPYTYRLNPAPFHWTWTALATYQQALQGREMMYSVGYRGVNDEPFWNEDVQCDTLQCRGATISQAIANQTAIASAMPSSGPPPRFVTYMWMELLALHEAGVLVIPPGVACIWTDFPGVFSLNAINASSGDGFYAHIQMMSGAAAQLTEFIPPRRIFANVWEFWTRNATAYGMINVSDMKMTPLTAEAVYKYMWDPAGFNATMAAAAAAGITSASSAQRSAGRRVGRRGPIGWWPAAPSSPVPSVTPQAAQDALIADFAMRHYGASGNASIPAAVADIYGRYFNISYMAPDAQCASPAPPCAVGDHYLGSQLRALLQPFQAAVDAGSRPASLADEATKLDAFASPNVAYVTDLFLSRVLPLQAYIPAGVPANMYAATIVMQVAVHYSHVIAMSASAASAIAYVDGDAAGAVANATVALQAMDSLLDYMRAGEGAGAWHGSYAREAWTWCWGSRAQLEALTASLQGKTLSPAPNNPYPDYNFMTYECPTNDPTACNTFPLSYFNASIAWDVLVRIVCANGTSGCTNSWTGATYIGSNTSVSMYIAPSPARGVAGVNATIHYTLDGSAPSVLSPTFTGSPVVVGGGNVTVRAQAFDAGTQEAYAVDSLAIILQA